MLGLEQKTKVGVSRKQYTSTALLRYIIVDGETIKAGDATNEEFYHYVYALLERFCEEELSDDPEIVELRYQQTFDLDWGKDEHRVMAINEFNRMNRARRTCGLSVIALFVQ